MRKTPVRNFKVISCAECGASVVRKSPAVFCLSCLQRRRCETQKRSRIAHVTRDPDYYRKQNKHKREWAHRQVIAKGPIHCPSCGKALPRIRGRHEDALCEYDRRLNRRYINTMQRAISMRNKKPLLCIDCGVELPHVRGLAASRARCVEHRKARETEMRRRQRARKRERELSRIQEAAAHAA